MAKKNEKPEPVLDEDGITVIEYSKTVLVIVPPDGFGEQGVCFARAQLQSLRVGTRVASSRYDEVLRGRLQEFFLADETLDEVDVARYEGVLIASGEGNALADDGRLVQIAFLQGPQIQLNFAQVMMRRLTITGSTLRPQSDLAKAKIADALRTDVWPLLESGRVAPVMDSEFALADAVSAHQRMESSGHIGKIVMKVA